MGQRSSQAGIEHPRACDSLPPNKKIRTLVNKKPFVKAFSNAKPYFLNPEHGSPMVDLPQGRL